MLPSSRRAPICRTARLAERARIGQSVRVGKRWVTALSAALVGATLGFAAWLAIAPWDLSEVDKAGRVVVGGGDQLAPQIAAALVVVTAMYCVGALVSDRVPILWACGASCAMWVALWVWRASVARVDGANLWPVGLVLAVLPAAALAFGAVAFCSVLRSRLHPTRTTLSPPFDQ
jgi:hypothetical protein